VEGQSPCTRVVVGVSLANLLAIANFWLVYTSMSISRADSHSSLYVRRLVLTERSSLTLRLSFQNRLSLNSVLGI
jgi:hypothetical protein